MKNITDIRTVDWWFQHNITPEPPYVPLHTHSFYELYCFLSGDVVYHIEGNSYHLKPYDILVINNNESHTVEFLSNAPYDRICLHFRKDFVETIDKTGFLLAPFEKRVIGTSNLFRPSEMKDNACEFLLNHLIKEVPNREIHISSTFFALLNELARNFISLESTNQIENPRLGEIIQYINDNICEDLMLDDICKRFYISKAQLLRLFKNTLGTTVHNYIIVKRLAIARQMLALGNNPVKVYQNCGFSNYSVFYKAFKKHYGYIPSQPLSTWQDTENPIV